MISEIVSSEAKDIKSSSLENYKNIKPEKDMSSKEVNDFWTSEFKQEAENAKMDGKDNSEHKEYFDDNGEK